MNSIPESGRSLGWGHGNSFQYSCLEDPIREEPGRLKSIDAKSQIQQKWLSMHNTRHILKIESEVGKEGGWRLSPPNRRHSTSAPQLLYSESPETLQRITFLFSKLVSEQFSLWLSRIQVPTWSEPLDKWETKCHFLVRKARWSEITSPCSCPWPQTSVSQGNTVQHEALSFSGCVTTAGILFFCLSFLQWKRWIR